MKPVAIIGAGITGLTAAFYLKRQGLPVVVYEESDRVGGAIRSLRRDGYIAEFGPNTILETSPKIAQLVRDAGLAERRLDPDPAAEARYVVRYRRPIAMPGTPQGFFTTDLFTIKAKLAVLREPFVRRRRDGREESIAEFVVRRLNQEFLDHAIDALVAGVYAGDPYKLSVTQAFPRLAEVERRYGSLIKGQILGARERKRRGEVAKDRAPKFSFDEGLQVLPETLRERLGPDIRFNTAVTKLTRTAAGWTVTLLEGGVGRGAGAGKGQAEHSAVVYAGTAFRLAGLELEVVGGPVAVGAKVAGGSPRPGSCPSGGGDEPKAVSGEGATIAGSRSERTNQLSSSPQPATPRAWRSGSQVTDQEPRTGERSVPSGATGGLVQGGDRENAASENERLSLTPFSEIRYPPVASVVLGFRREDVAHPCQGFGMLIPKAEGFRILGTIFSSSLFPNRAPAGQLLLTSYVGGERCPELAALPSERLCELTGEDLRVLLGVKGKPTFQHCAFYPKAIPQYNVGYGRYRAMMTEIEARAPGLFFAGHYRDGISLGDCIVSGCNVADRVAEAIKSTGG